MSDGRMEMRYRWLLLVLALTFIISGAWLIKRDQLRISLKEGRLIEKAYRQKLENWQTQFVSAKTLPQFHFLEAQINQLKLKDAERLRPLLDLEMIVTRYKNAEKNLFQGRSLFTATDNEKIAQPYVELAFTEYQALKELIDGLTEIDGEQDYNFRLNYIRGNIYYRYLVFLAEPEEVREVFYQTALAWERALAFREKDIDTEMNLEILSVNQDSLLSNANKGLRERLQTLPYACGGVPYGQI